MRHTLLTIAALICAVATIGLSQSSQIGEQKHLMVATPEGPNIGLSANNIERNETAWDVIKLKGNVEIKTKDIILHADEAAYNAKTGEIEAHGTVRIKLATQR